MFASLFDELKFSVGLGAGFGMLFFLLQMLSEVSEDIQFFKCFTSLTLFNPESLVKYETESIVCLGILFVFAIIFIILTVIDFKKRDLSL